MKAFDKQGNLRIDTNEITFNVLDIYHNPITKIIFEEEDYFIEHESKGLNKCISFYEMLELEEIIFSNYIKEQTNVFRIIGCVFGFGTHLDLSDFKSLTEVNITACFSKKISLPSNVKKIKLINCNIASLDLNNIEFIEELFIEKVPLNKITPLRNISRATFIETNLKKIEIQTQMNSLTCDKSISLNQDKVNSIQIVD